MSRLRAPFPWFGGKSRAADLIWAGLGDPVNYVEPFAGSLATLLSRKTVPRIETVNDLDCYLSNFWRAVQAAPSDVARWADWPVIEADLHARHRWLVNQVEFRERMKHEPDFFDPLVAGWWVWGVCQWIGGGWCAAPEWTARPNAGRRARGVLTTEENRRPMVWGNGVHSRMRDLAGSSEVNNEKRPHLWRGGVGVHAGGQLPAIAGASGASGRGVHASGLSAKMAKADRGTDSRLQGRAIEAWMLALQERLRRVRVCCGDWSRVLGPSSTEKIGVTGILLDPPYGAAAGRDPSLYAHDSQDVAVAVHRWAVDNGDNPKLRIVLCGYEGEHEMPATWQCVAWKASGGYASAAGNHENAARERLWFSPHCDQVHRVQGDLFLHMANTPAHAAACETEQRVYRALVDGLAAVQLEQQEGAGA